MTTFSVSVMEYEEDMCGSLALETYWIQVSEWLELWNTLKNPVTDKYHMISLYVESKTNDTNGLV